MFYIESDFINFSGPIASALLNKFGIRPVAFFGSLLIGAAYAGGSCMRGIPGLIATIGMLAGNSC